MNYSVLRSLVAVLILGAIIGSPVTIVSAEDCSKCDFPDDTITGGNGIWGIDCSSGECVPVSIDPNDP